MNDREMPLLRRLLDIAIEKMADRFGEAQKLHGLTDPSQNRPHDLVDLQLILSQSKVDLTLLRKTAIRLFAYRNRQPWPGIVHKGDDWEIGYDAAKYDLPVLPTVDEAVLWANDLIAKINEAK